MKVNVVFALIAFAIASLIGYGFFAANSGEPYQLFKAIYGGVTLFIPLAGIFAVSAGGRGGKVHTKVVSMLFFIAVLVAQLIFNFVVFRLAPYIIITGILLLVYVLICYAVARTGE
jgi:hypothetical protein